MVGVESLKHARAYVELYKNLNYYDEKNSTKKEKELKFTL